MTDRVWHTEPPLTSAELAARLNESTTLKIEHAFDQPVIRRDWVVGNQQEGTYGYAERRDVVVLRESAVEMTVPGVLDVTALAKVVLAEIERQHAALKAQPRKRVRRARGRVLDGAAHA